MNLSQRGRKVKKKTQKSNRGMSDTDSGRTRELMIVVPRENLIEMEEKLKTLSESK